MAYYGLLVRRAATDTSLLNWGKAWLSLGSSAAALVLQWNAGIRPLPATLQIIATVAGAYVVVLLLSFLANLVLAPARVHREQRQALDALRFQRVTHEDKNGVADFRSKGVHLQARGERMNPFDLAEWVAEHERWRADALAFMQSRFPKYQWSRFADLGELPQPLGPTLGGEHHLTMQRLRVEIHRLEDILRGDPE